MADFTHAPFRQLVAELGGCTLFFTEMLNIRIVSRQSLEKDPYCSVAVIDRPLVAQLVGNDPERIVGSIRRLESFGFDAFDINMGCTRKSIMRHGWGLGLMKSPELAKEVVKAARSATRRPLFVKIRSGIKHDPERLVAFGKAMESLGVDGITLHPRVLGDGFKRPARWEEIRILRESLSIPVFGNGDIVSPEDVFRMWEETGCNGIMIGRAALVRPWIFWEAVNQEKWPGDRLDVLERMAFLTWHLSPPELRVKRFFLFCSWFLRNWQYYQYLLGKMRNMDSLWDMLKFLLDELGSGAYPLVKTPFTGRL